MSLEPMQRAALAAILDFLVAVTSRSCSNRMNVQNVATVMAPTLFPEPADLLPEVAKLQKNAKANKRMSLAASEQLSKLLSANGGAMERAMRSCAATKMLIFYRRFIFHVDSWTIVTIELDLLIAVNFPGAAVFTQASWRRRIVSRLKRSSNKLDLHFYVLFLIVFNL